MNFDKKIKRGGYGMSGKTVLSIPAFKLFVLLIGTLIISGCGGHRTQVQPEKIFINGRVITMDGRIPKVEALAVAGGKIISIGTTEEVRNSHPKAEVVDLKGKTVMPGIIESHGHLLSLGQSFLELNLVGVQTPQEAVERVRERVSTTPEGEWVVGWGWDEGAWARDYPTNDELNKVSPKNPVCLNGLHGFSSWANKKALEIAGITSETPNPANGEILKDARSGNPTGILTNSAQDLVARSIPPLTQAQVEKALILAVDECLKYGLTTVHEADTTAPMLDALRSLEKKGKLKCRIYVMLDGTDKKLLEPFFAKGPEIDPSQILTVRCIKIFIDGALGSRGAALLEPYSDAPDAKGVIVTSEDSLFQLTVQALKSGLQVAVHAIGDRANRIALNAYGRALAEVRSVKDHRLRVEHAQVVSLEDIPKFSVLGIIVSMQPPHCTSDMSWAEKRLGPDRAKGAYAWRSFLDTGVHLALNSDFPGETLNPFYGMYAAETRQTPDGKPDGGWYPEQCLSRQEVLKAYTVESAYAGFEEGIKGKILPGMLADFIVLSDDILSIPSQALLSLQVEQTYVGGRLIYNRVLKKELP
jgi:predicted amidohydrolase YtcJ